MAKEGEKFAYTLDELALRGCGSRAFLYLEIKARRLKATKQGKRTIVLNSDLEAYLASLPAFKLPRQQGGLE